MFPDLCTSKNLPLSLIATKGTAAYLKEHDIEVEVVNKVAEGRPHIVDLIKNKDRSMRKLIDGAMDLVTPFVGLALYLVTKQLILS